MKRILAWITVLLLTVCMAGCAESEQGVDLKTEREVKRYAANHFGKATVVNTEKSEDANRITYTMQDKEHGFQYEIVCYACEFGLLDSRTGMFYEETSDDFQENYHDYIISQFDPQEILSVMRFDTDHDVMLFAITCQSQDTAEEEARDYIKKVKKIDKRGYFADGCIGIYDKNGEFLGSCSLEDGTFTDLYERDVEQMTYRFAVEVNHTTNDLSGITYLYYKRVQYKDVERLNIDWLCYDGKTPEDWTTAYYFDYNGTEYFMLPDYVTIIDEPGIEGTHYAEYYTSYWFTEE